VTSVTGDEVRQALVAVVERGDQAELQRLCLEHRATIESAFASWKSVPPEWRADQGAVERYVATLLAVAEFFARGLGRPQLLRHLTGRDRAADDPSPIDRWHDSLERAQTLLREQKHAEAAALLQAIVDETAGLRGSWVDQYLPVTLGMLGTAHFNAGRVEEAVEPTRRALSICEGTGDVEGIVAYVINLHEIERWRGHAEAAAELADRLGELLAADDPARARRYVERARRLRAGEPLLRVVVVPEGSRNGVELDQLHELPEQTSRMEFAFERNRVTLGAANALCEAGRAAAERGELEDALQLFDRAAEIDPHDPEPHYQAGMCLAELQRFEEARERWFEVEARAPGWYRVTEDLALADAILAGHVDPHVLRIVRELEDGPRPPRAKIAMARTAIEQFGDVARIHYALGKAHLAVGELDEALAAWLRALETASDRGIETRTLTDLGATAIDPAKGHRWLHRAVDLAGDLVAAAQARVMLYLAHPGTS
jgi:tetratricopeptide (TPR) repeat protein